MEQTQQLKERISQLQGRIADLKKVLSGDMASSHKEATQTNEMIEVYERQVCNLREEIANIDSGMVSYLLEDETGSCNEYHLVDFAGDPFKRMVSEASPLGQQLMKGKVGSKVQIGQKTFTIKEIKRP